MLTAGLTVCGLSTVACVSNGWNQANSNLNPVAANDNDNQTKNGQQNYQQQLIALLDAKSNRFAVKNENLDLLNDLNFMINPDSTAEAEILQLQNQLNFFSRENVIKAINLIFDHELINRDNWKSELKNNWANIKDQKTIKFATQLIDKKLFVWSVGNKNWRIANIDVFDQTVKLTSYGNNPNDLLLKDQYFKALFDQAVAPWKKANNTLKAIEKARNDHIETKK